jgi:hypothetical protein
MEYLDPKYDSIEEKILGKHWKVTKKALFWDARESMQFMPCISSQGALLKSLSDVGGEQYS